MNRWIVCLWMFLVGCAGGEVPVKGYTSPLPQLAFIQRSKTAADHVFENGRLVLPDTGGQRVSALVTSRLSSAGGFHTAQVGPVLPRTLRIRVHREEEEYVGTMPITSDMIMFEVIGNLGDTISLQVDVLDEGDSVIGTASREQLVLDGHSVPVTLEVELPGIPEELPVASVPVEVSLHRPLQKTPIQVVGATPVGDTSGPQDPVPAPEAPASLLLVVGVEKQLASLDLYDFSSRKRTTLLQENVSDLEDVAVDWEIGFIYRAGPSGLARASIAKVFRNGAWAVDIGEWESLLPPRFSGYTSDQAPVLSRIHRLGILDGTRLVLLAPNPFHGADDHMWLYDISSGDVELLNDDSRSGEEMEWDRASGTLLYGERSPSGASYVWSLFDRQTKTFQSRIVPPAHRSIAVASLRPGGKEVAYYGPESTVTIQNLGTGEAHSFPVSKSVEELCWDPSGSKVAVISYKDGFRLYDGDTGRLLQESGALQQEMLVRGGCQFL